MNRYIFYSWQSDSPPAINRNFIEEAIKEAIKEFNEEVGFQEAIRFDKDTKGVGGTPEIVSTIFEKIHNCSVFISDITFIGKAKRKRYISNPNVLIEYGFAVKAKGNNKIVLVMNTIPGEPKGENLPFDIRHLRRPITYKLKENAEKSEKVSVKAQLVKDLKEAIKLVLEKEPFNDTPFSGMLSGESPSTFLKQGEIFPSDGRVNGKLPDGQRMFLHLIPNKPINIESERKALELVESSILEPMGVFTGWFKERNQYGAYTCGYQEKVIQNISQLFLSGELWGIDAYHIHKDRFRENKFKCEFFPYLQVEDIFIKTLDNYLKFSRNILKLPLPLKFVAGVTDIKNYGMAKPDGGIHGRVDHPNIIYDKGYIDNYSTSPSEILKPFFELLWDKCGLKRPEK